MESKLAKLASSVELKRMLIFCLDDWGWASCLPLCTPLVPRMKNGSSMRSGNSEHFDISKCHTSRDTVCCKTYRLTNDVPRVDFGLNATQPQQLPCNRCKSAKNETARNEVHNISAACCTTCCLTTLQRIAAVEFVLKTSSTLYIDVS